MAEMTVDLMVPMLVVLKDEMKVMKTVVLLVPSLVELLVDLMAWM